MAARRPARPQDAARPRPRPAQPRVRRAQADLVRLHRGRAAHPAHPDGGLRRRAAGLDGHRHPDRRAVAAVPAALRLLRRTLRPGDQPAAGCHPRRGRHLDGPRDGPRAEPPRADRGVVPPDRAALAGARQRRTQQDRPHQRRRRAPRSQDRGAARPLRRRTRAARASPTRSRTCGCGACDAIAKGARTLVISDRDSDHTRAPIPSLLAVSAVHHHLVRTKERTTVALVVESGDAREVHHIAMLIGFGAAAVNPYLAFESIEDLIREGELTGIEPATAVRNYLKALGKGVMKVMSKMGISTVASYTAAQAFEAVGIDRDVIDEYFTGTPTQLGGVGLDVHRRGGQAAAPPGLPGEPDRARAPPPRGRRRIRVPPRGRTAPVHPGSGLPAAAFDPHRPPRHLQPVLRRGEPALPRGRHAARPVRVQEAAGRPCRWTRWNPSTSIVTRFNTGAMSYGSISAEAHETMAIAMNNLGGRSNSGEGGEDTDRLYDPQTAQRRQAGRVRPLRRHQRLPGERHRHPDQDGPGRQTR